MNHRDTETQGLKTGCRRKSKHERSKLLRYGILCVSVSLWCLLIVSCSVPNLEKPECTESREAAKKFYSFHFGNDMRPSVENLKLREKFLTKELFARLSSSAETAKDYFTRTESFPKAFRIGSCESVSPEKTIFQVLLLWHDDDKNVQREIKVEMIRENNMWLVNRILDQ
jgi:hypothetical protein